MRALAAVSDGARCKRCQAAIGGKASYHGYCLRCVLRPAIEPGEVNQHRQERRFDPYEILTDSNGSAIELGHGAMGITYRAIDNNLDVPVALKVINSKVASQEANWERFVREARATARLHHAHVVNVLHYGVATDGQCFYVMELVEGETLADRVQRSGPQAPDQALEVIAQIASALDAAEKQGLVHRDLKPSNLMLVNGPGIEVKVIDFGLAKILNDQEPIDRITQDGFVGTPGFASPEQIAGIYVDQRSDYFSLGCTLFYLLTGDPPFGADDTGELARQRSHRDSLTLRLERAGLAAPVRRLLHCLLSAAPEGRPQNAKALAAAIAKCRQDFAKLSATTAKPKALKVVVAASAVLLAGAISFLLGEQARTKSAEEKSVAVLPFDSLSPNQRDAYFADGIQDDILTNLANIADLRVISRESIRSYRNSAHRPPPREIGRELHVRYLLDGSVQREGDRVRLSARLEDAENGHELWAERYDGRLADIFSIQTELAEAVSQALRAKLSAAEQVTLREAPTHDLGAYELYLHAKAILANYDYEVEGWEPLYSTERLLKEAVARDPSFALAWCLLGTVSDKLYWYNVDRSDARKEAAEHALRQALSQRPSSGQVHVALGYHLLATSRDYDVIRSELEIGRRTLPNAADLFSMLSSVESRQGKWGDALRDREKALVLNPRQIRSLIARCELYVCHRQYDEARLVIAGAIKAGDKPNAMAFEQALITAQEKGDTSALHALLNDPNDTLHDIVPATVLNIGNALAEHDYAAAERILAADPKQEFEFGQKRFVCRDFLLGWIKRTKGDSGAATINYQNARPLQLAYVRKWPDDPNPSMMLAITDAALGRKEEALREAHLALEMPASRDAVDGPLLAVDLAQVYLWVGERELAMKQLEDLEQVPRALTYGDLKNSREWDALRDDHRFQSLLLRVQLPIPIANRTSGWGTGT